MFKPYEDIYQKIDFERIELFKAINERYHPMTVLYPGSSVHISPSIIFQNTTYVDPSQLSSEFFQSMERVKEFVSREAQYRQKPFIRFLNSSIEDCAEIDLELFDLVFSAFSGNLIKPSWKYLNNGGIYISNNHQNELRGIDSLPGAGYVGFFAFRKGKYHFNPTLDRGTIQATPVVYKDNKATGLKYQKMSFTT